MFELPVASLADVLRHEFMQRAFLAGLLVSVVAGIVGAYVVINRMVFISGAIAHVAFGGIGLAYYFGIPPMHGALGFSVASAVGMGVVERLGRERADTLIGALWAIGMAMGMLLIKATPGIRADPMTYLFGTITMIPEQRVTLMLGLALVVLLVFALLYKEWLAVSFDPTFASVRNVPVFPLKLLQLALVAGAVVMLMEVVGLILVLALLTLPVATANLWLRDFRLVVLAAILLAALSNTLGLWLAYHWNLMAGPTIVLLAAAIYLAAFFLHLLWRTLRPRRADRQSPPLSESSSPASG